MFFTPVLAEEEDEIIEIDTVENFTQLLQSDVTPLATLNKIQRVAKLDNGYYVTMMDIDGTLVYCLDPTIMASLGEGFSVDYSTLSDHTRDTLWRYAFYGYGYAHHQDTSWYVATQVLIWNELGFHVNFTTLDGQPYDVSIQMNEIRYLSNGTTHQPCFHGQTITLDYMIPITLTDTNGYLQQYPLPHANGIQLEKSGNDLTLTIHDLDYDSALHFATQGINSTLVYVKPGSQSVMSVSRNQPGNQFHLNVEMNTGTLIIDKIDEYDKPLVEPVTFNIFTHDDLSTPFLTNLVTQNSKLTLSEVLPPGEYILQEESTPIGFLPNDTLTPFTILKDQTTSLVIENTYRNETLTIQKNDAEVLELSLNDAYFSIYDVSDMLDKTHTYYQLQINEEINISDYFDYDEIQVSEHFTLNNNQLVANRIGTGTITLTKDGALNQIEVLISSVETVGLLLQETTIDEHLYLPDYTLFEALFEGYTGMDYFQLIDPSQHNLPIANKLISFYANEQDTTPLFEAISNEYGIIKLTNDYANLYYQTDEMPQKEIAQVVYSSEGTLVLPHLKYGRTYSVCETVAPVGYQVQPSCQFITLNEEFNSRQFFNEKLRVDLTFYKADSDNLSQKLDDAVFEFEIHSINTQTTQTVTLLTGRLNLSAVDEHHNPIENAQFQVSSSEDFTADVIEIFTQADGTAFLDLPHGKYYVKDMRTQQISVYQISEGAIYFDDLVYGDHITACEIIPPSGYYVADDCRTIEIKSIDQTHAISYDFDNASIPKYEDIPNMGTSAFIN